MDKDLHIGVAVAIINQDGEILLGKRLGIAGKGKWQVPGGHAEANETFEETCHRETFEETGLLLADNIKFLGYQDNFFEEKQKWYRTFFYLTKLRHCSPLEPENKEPDKCEGWHWFPGHALPSPLFEWAPDMLKKLTDEIRSIMTFES